MSVDTELQDATYLYLLGQVKGIGLMALHQIVRAFPQPHTLMHASSEEIAQKLDRHISQILIQNVLNRWEPQWEAAQKAMQLHLDKQVLPLPITGEQYPHFLKQIPDPPAILYVKGDSAVLSNADAIAIVGTREPTPKGKEVARSVAKHFAANGYVVISGLAKGIDTAAHEGALEAGGKTIAVFGTPLDKIYPAENKQLAKRICDESGALVSELALGQESFKTSFVRRDRIQSGLSLGVIPVQTKREGGTMHTVEFARKQKRLIFCPHPLASEANADEYEGIWYLIKELGVQDFHVDEYTEIVARCAAFREQFFLNFTQSLVTLLRNNDGKKPIQQMLEF